MLTPKKVTIYSLILIFISVTSIIFVNKVTKDISGVLNTLEQSKAMHSASKIPRDISDEEALDTKNGKVKNPEVKIEFWDINKETLQKGNYIGGAFLEKGKIYTAVENPQLEQILENPYTPLAQKESLASEKTIYYPGTFSHLKAIQNDSWYWGTVSEIKILRSK